MIQAPRNFRENDFDTHSDSPRSSDEYESIIVVCACDDNYAMPLTITIRSAIANLNSSSKILLFIIDGEIKTHNKQKIFKSLSMETCEVKFISKPDLWLKDIEKAYQYGEVENISKSKYISLAAYYRLFIPELLPDQIEKVIYLDCDLVVKGDLYELWKIDLRKNYVLAVQDMWINNVSSPDGIQNYQELGIPPSSKYFNSGVLVINVTKWREDKITFRAIEYLNQNQKFIRYHDQEVLNSLFANKWGQLSPKWNLQTIILSYASWRETPFSIDVYEDLIFDPYIIHYVTARKPWTARNVPLEEHFYHYVDMTVWSGWRLTFLRHIWLRLIRKIRNIISNNR